MTVIKEPVLLFRRVLRAPGYDAGAEYVRASWVVWTPVDGGVLALNTLTRELVLLEGMSSPDEADPAALVAKRFWIPAGTDERKLIDECKQTERLLHLEQTQKGLSAYTIFTTTDCNARCFYCFEQGCDKLTMSRETAEEVAAFIARTRNPDRRLVIHWFGGEPLVNAEAIDIVSRSLREQGIDFYSTATTNGYLFDEATAERAVRDWRMTRVQITLDGTRERYNRIKAYVAAADDPYERVMGNIGALLAKGMQVTIRLNLDAANGEDLEALIDELGERFGGAEKIRIYVKALYQLETSPDAAKRDAIRARQQQLDRRAAALLGKKKHGLSRALKYGACIADSDSGTIILPDGRLLCCEHLTERPMSYGTIWDDESDYDRSVLAWWKEREERIDACDGCFYAPMCYRIAHCPAQGPCWEGWRDQLREQLDESMREEYNAYMCKSGQSLS